MARRRRFRDNSEEEASVNLTPLIDVVFVVLIMFIIVAPMLELDKVQLAKAAPHTTKNVAMSQPSDFLSIHVRADNTILINNKQVTLIQLQSLLKEAKRRTPKAVPQLFHDRKAYFETYQSIKNAVEMAGFEEMDVILQPG